MTTITYDNPIVAFCTPTYGPVSAEAAYAHEQAAVRVMARGWPQASFATTNQPVDRARNYLTQQALNAGATHILWLDSDIIPPRDVVERLVAHRVPVASGLYHYKQPPFRPMVFNLREPHGLQGLDDPAVLDGPVQVEGTGFGCILTTTAVMVEIANLVGHTTWFRTTLEEGEDVYFCRLLREVGHGVLLDPSVRCGHVTTAVITTEDWLAGRADYEQAHAAGTA